MEDKPIASIVIEMLNKSIKRIYTILIITIILFIISIADSFYQRYVIKNLLQEYNFYEEIETYEMETENGSNNYIGGDNNGKIENN